MSTPAHTPVDVPSAWVRRWAPLAPRGEALDLACGSGRHARLLAGLGHQVLAVDRDDAALASTAGQGIATCRLDLETAEFVWPYHRGRFAVIVVTNYLHRPLMAQLFESLAPDGLLIYETFAKGNEAYGKPSNPAFLLEEGELIKHAAAAGLSVIAFEDGFADTPKPAMVQRLCACGPAFSRQGAQLSSAASPGAHGQTGQE
jgi:SAM-dependent methyltransferase